MRLAKYLVLAALAVAVAAADASACGRRCRSSVVCCPPVCHWHYPAGRLIIHVPADAVVTVGGAPLHQTGEVRTDTVAWYPGAIEVCVEVKATLPNGQVRVAKACFQHPGQTVHVTLGGVTVESIDKPKP
ncbi:MAG: hypothetical protein K2X82_24150 [Gemmataceae bacterium]|nr:hypothetical protein [Gemmataceae bacterium]